MLLKLLRTHELLNLAINLKKHESHTLQAPSVMHIFSYEQKLVGRCRPHHWWCQIVITSDSCTHNSSLSSEPFCCVLQISHLYLAAPFCASVVTTSSQLSRRLLTQQYQQSAKAKRPRHAQTLSHDPDWPIFRMITRTQPTVQVLKWAECLQRVFNKWLKHHSISDCMFTYYSM